MKKLIVLFFLFAALNVSAKTIQVASPNGDIKMNFNCGDVLSYSVTFHEKTLVSESPLGFEFKGEKPMKGNFVLLGMPKVVNKSESWQPVVKNKHENISATWNETTLQLKEKDGDCRQMGLIVRVYNDGIAFRYRLFGAHNVGNRKITKELTGFSLPVSASAWITTQKGKYRGSQENEYVKTPLSKVDDNVIAGLPFVVEIDKNNYLAISEAYLDDYPGSYIGGTGIESNGLKTFGVRLSPLPGEDESGVKACFDEQAESAWRVVMIGRNPGEFIESELIRALNPPCAITDTSWIKPGMCAWDHWWSGEVDMKMETIKKYIDLASVEGWPYMLVDWQWYGPYNKPQADITKAAPQLDMPEILRYAKSKNVKIWLWLYCSDVNRNDNYRKAFALYEKWGVAGVKIDFLNRNDQEMVNWYRRIVMAAANHKLMVDFHGAYCPDGIDRTYPNQVTREGVLGEEYSKFSKRIVPEHNVTLAFTRMLVGAMDYTPGGFLNVTPNKFKEQSPTLVMNTRCAELSKFVIYESPLTVVCDHPAHIMNQPGADFLKIVPTTWDDTRFLGGYPDEYIAMAKRSGDKWFVAVMNNSVRRTIDVDTSFLSTGDYTLTYWADGKNADNEPTELIQKKMKFKSGKSLKIKMANGGGYVGVLTR